MKSPDECRKMSEICRQHSASIISKLLDKEDKATKESIKLAIDGIVQAAVLETAALLAESSNKNLPRRTG